MDAGFYTTTNKEHAKVFAQKVGERRESEKCYINIYETAVLEYIVPRLIKSVMDEMGLEENDAFTMLYTSELYEKLDREETKLWHLSVPTLFDMLKEEMETNVITYPEEA